MYVSTLDVCYAEHEGETLEAALAHLTRELPVTARVLIEVGPGGGWPVVEFTAMTEAALTALHERYVSGTVVTGDPARTRAAEREEAAYLDGLVKPAVAPPA